MLLFPCLTLLFLLHPLLVTSHPQITCSSLVDGPYCPFVNGKSLPLRFKIPKGNPFVALVEDFIKELGKPNAGKVVQKMPHTVFEGSFRVRGTVSETKPPFVKLWPTDWIEKPGPSWVAMGFQGYVPKEEGNFMKLDVVDPATGAQLWTCSDMPSWKERRGLRRSVGVDGTWGTQYACGGARSNATMVLVARGKDEVGNEEVDGEFRFKVQLFPGAVLSRAGCACKKEWVYRGVLRSGCFVPEKGTVPSKDDARSWCMVESWSCARWAAGVVPQDESHKTADAFDYCTPPEMSQAATPKKNK